MDRTVAHNLAEERPIQPLGALSVRESQVRIMLPAYNEARAMPPLLEAIRCAMQSCQRPYRVIVVDDGSDDDTALLVSKRSFDMPVDLIQHQRNLGLAAALRTGLTTALSGARPDEVVVTMDADNTHPPELIPSLLGQLDTGLDVVIASRYRRGARISGVPANRNALSFGARLLFQLAFPIPGVRDYTCGYRAYRVSALQDAMEHFGDRFITEEGFSSMAEILLRLRYRGALMGEVPLELNYHQRGGQSKMRVARTVGQTLGLILRQRLGIT
jgi:dolichol-phosphate mannosyltransferase